MIDTLERIQSTVSVNGKIISNLRLPDDINLAGSEEELIVLTDSLDKTSIRNGVECR